MARIPRLWHDDAGAVAHQADEEHAGLQFHQRLEGDQALSVLANSSDATVRTPGVMKAHSIATHPSPTRASVIAWRCEKGGTLRIRAMSPTRIRMRQRRHLALEVRRGHTSEVLAKGETKGRRSSVGPFRKRALRVRAGRRAGHRSEAMEITACDLTGVNLTLSDGTQTWDLAKDVSPNILAGNPHGAWHFLSQPASLDAAPDVPGPVAEWRKQPSPELAAKVREFFEKDFPLNSPLLRPFLANRSDSSNPIGSDRQGTLGPRGPNPRRTRERARSSSSPAGSLPKRMAACRCGSSRKSLT
jgi:hypothetical protein